MVLTGLVAAFHKAVPLLRLKGRFIQLSLNSVYSLEEDLQKKVMLLPEARRNLLWMAQLQLLYCHGHLWPLPQTKASAFGSRVTSTFGDISMSGMEYFSVTLCF
jgi:hypothetical protein